MLARGRGLMMLLALLLTFPLVAPVSRAATAPAAIVKDIAAVDPGESSDPHSFVRVGKKSFFVANGHGTGDALWVTDGTGAATELLADHVPGPSDSDVDLLTAVGT